MPVTAEEEDVSTVHECKIRRFNEWAVGHVAVEDLHGRTAGCDAVCTNGLQHEWGRIRAVTVPARATAAEGDAVDLSLRNQMDQ